MPTQQADSTDNIAALIATAQKPDLKEFGQLVEQGVDYMQVKIEDYPLFIWLASHRRIDFVKYLIKKGVDINQTDDSGNTALMLAADNNYVDVVDLLIKSDAELDKKNKDGETAISLAAKKRSVKVLESLIQSGADYNNIKIDDKPLFIWAGTSGHDALAKVIMGHKASASERKINTAAEKKDVKAIEKLLDEGADFKEVRIENQSLFIWAARYGHVTIVEKLLAKDKNIINQGDQYGATALKWAAQNSHIDLVIFLLNKGASFASVQVSGKSLLEWAAFYNHSNLVEKLIDLGADYQNVRVRNIPLLQWAIRNNHTAIIAKLPKDHNAIDNSDISALYVAVGTGNVDLAEELIEKGADTTQTDKQGRTPLQAAVQAGNSEMVKTLLDNGAAVDNESNSGESLFFTAVVDGNNDIAVSIASQHVKNFFKWLAIVSLVVGCAAVAVIGIGALVGWAPALAVTAWFASVLTPSIIAIAATAIGSVVVLSYAGYTIHNKLKQRSRTQRTAEKLKHTSRLSVSEHQSDQQKKTHYQPLFAAPKEAVTSTKAPSPTIQPNSSN